MEVGVVVSQCVNSPREIFYRSQLKRALSRNKPIYLHTHLPSHPHPAVSAMDHRCSRESDGPNTRKNPRTPRFAFRVATRGGRRSAYFTPAR